VQLIIVILLATLLFGFSPEGGLVGVAGAFGLSLVVGWALAWAFIALASWLRDAEVMQSIGLVVMFPLMFASSAFVTIDGLPGWLQAVAKVNPLTYAVDASRDLALRGSAGLTALLAVGMSLVLVAVGGFVAARRIRLP
jgi:ABC-2 type transport system permease protein